jgi:hypothetical protein
MPHAKRSERGLLTTGNCVMTFIGLKPQLLFDVSTLGHPPILDQKVVPDEPSCQLASQRTVMSSEADRPNQLEQVLWS